MSTSEKVFIIGPGFIGWNVLDLLIEEGYTVSSLITIHTATISHLPSVSSVLTGLHHRASTDQPIISIHTSGPSVLDSLSPSVHKPPLIYTSTSSSPITASPLQPCTAIDLTIIRVRRLAHTHQIAIMIPPGFKARHKRLTIQIPTITRFALQRGWVGHVGKGLGVESQIHVLDLARAYIVLLHHMEVSSPTVFQANPCFFCENGKEFSWKEVAEEVGRALEARGLIADAQPREFGRGD
ncbi:hypothetical protein EJ04DRAFT_582192 [Polyplosphaeria fusca]|uniref:NAD(P)-binding domain-containing protein n=1 Tax=Polyplosphaeria fusca TaxID=682080 RepID=A0A9P4UVT7_9PLEO|nr:hypothetical protein EJ04DRAFT_582192 [Polyplosphaeria fusca]